ncbi:MAG: Gfo/Idh/MocA family oxidoreductase [Planctomycetes bacterium]|nr:Gfo/Idh/MocA family oxidoreductase [Planctomycetota bacterium]
MERLRMAVVGVGHLGKEHARVLAGMPDVDLIGVADVNVDQAHAVARRIGAQAFSEYWPLLNLVDAACIAVPTSLHELVAADFLRRGLHVLVEKPLAPSLQAAQNLVELADRHGAILQVGHIERFNPAFEEIQRRPLHPRYIRAERLGGFTGRSCDIGAVLDLMIHDLDLILAMVQGPVRTVDSLGINVFGGREDIASARIQFESGCVADVTASRAHPVPCRNMHIWGPEGYAGLDFAQRRVTLVQPSAEVRKNGLDPTKLDPASRACLRDELFVRHLETLTLERKNQDQLTCELRHFVDCVRAGRQPKVSGHAGRDAVALAERILAGMSRQTWTGIPAELLFSPHVDQEVA